MFLNFNRGLARALFFLCPLSSSFNELRQRDFREYNVTDVFVFQVLIMSDADADVLSNVKVLNISTCTFVSFPAIGFPKAKKLKSVQIRQMTGLFHISAATFPATTSLMIEDVNELIIEHNLGQSNLVNIEIKNTVLNEIGEDVFKDVKSLEKLLFQNVSINTIAMNSLNIPNNNPKLLVKFLNSKVSIL